VSSFKDGTKTGLRLSEGADNGVAYLQGIELGNGTIELDIRGKDVQQQSFVGVAFHGVDDTTYDAVYFRPFNFRTDDQARRKRAVQYVSHPTYPWQKLRAEHPRSTSSPSLRRRIRTAVPRARCRREPAGKRVRRRREAAQSGGAPVE